MRGINKQVKDYIIEARSLLPGLSSELSFVWDEKMVIPGNGTGGTLLKPTLLAIGYDPSFEDKAQLSKHLRATVLHECFHSVQGWSDQDSKVAPKTLLEDAILEGAAVVFEKQFGHTTPLWGEYESDDVMNEWLVEIKSQKLDPSSVIYADYKFGNVNGVNWMLYKVGTWIVDKALAKNPEITIIDLATEKPSHIIELADI